MAKKSEIEAVYREHHKIVATELQYRYHVTREQAEDAMQWAAAELIEKASHLKKVAGESLENIFYYRAKKRLIDLLRSETTRTKHEQRYAGEQPKFTPSAVDAD